MQITNELSVKLAFPAKFWNAMLDHCRDVAEARGKKNVSVRAAADLASASGNSAFGAALRAARVIRDFDILRNIVLVVDSDSDRQARFDYARGQIEALANDPNEPVDVFPLPSLPGVPATKGDLNLTILMIPTDEATGSLETVLYKGAKKAKSQNANEVEKLATATNVVSWAPQKQAKMRVRAFVACSHGDAPDLPIGQIWTKDSSASLIPVGDSVFDDLFDCLQQHLPE
ncbi:MAG: hypothetical protein GC151_13800 [Betaproteobacteria bacterium]|nr:hypothetical protein [Betaproteobacteria bacterium]